LVERPTTGHADWGRRDTDLPPKLSGLRQKLYQKAKREPQYRFYTLYGHIDADFLECSYGFRPERGAHDALLAIRQNLVEGYVTVYDADLGLIQLAVNA